MRRFLLTFIILIAALSLCAQEDSRSLLNDLDYKVEFQSSVSDGQTPLWLNANKHGLSSLDEVNGYLRGMVERPLTADSARNWGIGYALDLVAPLHYTSNFIIQQAFIEARWKKGVVTIGSKEFPMELKNNELSTGSQTLGINARPVPQVRLALPDYWIIPGTKNWLALKGHIAYGKTTDDHWQKDFKAPQSRYTEGTLYHSKAGYLKIGPGKFTAELGLEMACQFGGKSYFELSRDNWQWISNEGGLKGMLHAFVPGGGEVNEDTYQNASGNQVGSWVARLNYDADNWEMSAYLDHFFDDQSSMFMLDYDGYGDGEEWNTRKDNNYLLYDFKDMLLGFELKLKQNSWLNDVVVEYIYSKYQSGPVYHDRTKTISDHIGGNDNYYNHHIFTGWQHWGQVMGNPLYRSPIYNNDGLIRVTDNRFVAWHMGVSGNILSPLHYRLLTTYQTGWGTYNEPFTAKQYDFSMLAELSWQLKNGWSMRGAFAFDKGRILGDNVGAQLTIVKSGIFTK